MNNSQTAFKVREQLDRFLGIFSPHFSKPALKFLGDMLYGLQASKDVKLSCIGRGLDEGISTRMLIYAGVLIRDGLPPIDSCRMAMTAPITDDPDMQRALGAILESAF